MDMPICISRFLNDKKESKIKKSSREKIFVELQRQLKLKRILGIGDLVGR
jgi:hypothetical protein